LDIAKADGKLAWMINATDADLQTCLHTAASKSAREVAEILVEHEELGINATDVYGYTPVIHAVSERADVAFHLVELLLRHPLLDIFVGYA
jgi:ankyrin repeat protein